MTSRKTVRRMLWGGALSAAVAIAGLFPGQTTYAGTATTIAVDTASNAGAVNPFAWAVGAPDKRTWWAGNATLQTRIGDAKIKLVRVNPIQILTYNGRDPYPSSNTWNFAGMDAILNTIFDAGAEPLFVLAGFPAGVAHTRDANGAITSADWTEYAKFMKEVVKRYNTDLALGSGKKVRYWELWNEPFVEEDGKFRNNGAYKTFAQTVGNAMKLQDASIKLIGAVHSNWDDGAAGTDAQAGNGLLSYAAKNLESQIDLISWHNYGPSPVSVTDADRMTYTKKNYQDDVASVKAGGPGNVFKSPSGKLYGAALTEYNISHQPGGTAYDLKYHNEFGAVYLASAIVNAMKGGADIFANYNLAETGGNLLGLLNNTDYSPYKPYYTYQLFGNRMGSQKLAATKTGTDDNLEFVSSKDPATGKTYLIVVNKNTSTGAGATHDLTVQLQNAASSSGTVNVWKLDASTNPTASTTLTYSGGNFAYSVGPMSVVAFEVVPGSGGGTTPLFSNGFESADAPPTWLDTLDGSQNVTGYTAGTNPECSPRQEQPRTGIATLMFSGTDNSATVSYAKCKIFAVNIPITASTKLGYWLYPQTDNARYAAIDFVTTDGTTLRDSGLLDYDGHGVHPNGGHGGAIPLNAWTPIKINIGTAPGLVGKTIDRILVNYDRPASTGQYRGYIDDLVITNGTLP
ncbi:GH39 family glycosyl hydrolase [Cohnella nanjingensis]|uniref:Glycosyl hydrolases family 39 N-terminal catalytic domain-containing protein n=1 Tax=Cohnella nanjingensis TaxID=1387779 RepID=A0A7X0RUV4_9BACL|nr:hypothetical protein [Cohnella nanjingensis]MBB6673993.1 hypothetical protein [Cohnella nanjingensis]